MEKESERGKREKGIGTKKRGGEEKRKEKKEWDKQVQMQSGAVGGEGADGPGKHIQASTKGAGVSAPRETVCGCVTGDGAPQHSTSTKDAGENTPREPVCGCVPGDGAPSTWRSAALPSMPSSSGTAAASILRALFLSLSLSLSVSAPAPPRGQPPRRVGRGHAGAGVAVAGPQPAWRAPRAGGPWPP